MRRIDSQKITILVTSRWSECTLNHSYHLGALKISELCTLWSGNNSHGDDNL